MRTWYSMCSEKSLSGEGPARYEKAESRCRLMDTRIQI